MEEELPIRRREMYMEEEIDLRIYIDILLAWWWLIALGAVVVGVSAFIVTSLMPPVYEASAGVVSVRSRVEVSLGSGFETITEDSAAYGSMIGAGAIIERTKQRLNTLAGMVRNGIVAQQVAEELSGVLDEEELDPAVLLGRVKGRVLSLEGGGDSDTIEIVVSHPDPHIAALIANAWARAYEVHVNRIFGMAQLTPFGDIDRQVQNARADYDVAQEAYLRFLSEDDQISEIQRQVEEETIIVQNLRLARQTAIAAVVDKEVQVREALIDAYLSDAQANRLFAFERGQAAKRAILGSMIDGEIANRMAVIERDRAVREQLFSSAIDAEVAARLQVFEHERDGLHAALDRDYARRQQLEELLMEARMMREQLIAGGEPTARSNGLALIALKSRVFNVADSLPFDRLDLQATSIDALNPARSATEQIADLNGLITAMEDEVLRLDGTIQQRALARLSGEGYQFLDLLSPDHLSLVHIEDLDGVVAATNPLSPTLGNFILELYVSMFEVGPMALAAQNVATDTQLFAEIERLYPELYTRDAWMGLIDLIPDTPELVSLANQMADDLLKLRGLEELMAFSVADEPLSLEIGERELRIRALEANISRLTQRRRDLQQERDLAWQVYSGLLSKSQEVAIAAASEGSEVRFASPAVPPRSPVGPRRMMNTAVGLAVGLMGGTFAAFLFSYLELDNDPRALWAQLTKKGAASPA